MEMDDALDSFVRPIMRVSGILVVILACKVRCVDLLSAYVYITPVCPILYWMHLIDERHYRLRGQ